MTLKSKILGTGSALPKKIITNDDLSKVVDTTDEWISSRTGIRERRIALDGKTSELAARAAKEAIKAAGLSAKDIDLVITGTVTPDMAFPSTSCFVQLELGLRAGIPAFDLSAACSGFLYALDVADNFIRSKSAKNVLVIGVDLFSKIVDWKDRSTCVLFGDGAGAVVLGATKSKAGILSSKLFSDGRKWELLYSPQDKNRTPFEDVKSKAKSAKNSKDSTSDSTLKMKGNEIFKLAVRSMGSAVSEALKEARLKPSDISLLIPHQANNRIIKAMQQRLKLSDAQVFSNIEKYGNTSAASIPIALDEAVKSGRVKRGNNLILVAFGGGLTWASTVIKW
ncbi:MAG: ketoacyl-ACP synthase III [Deltaproteobacteria bacterium]|nr:ketoacyl-ACP synthase III [Deltaproteobacteria bacterium]